MYQNTTEHLKTLVNSSLKSNQIERPELLESTEKILSALHTNIEYGLNEEQVLRSRNHFGSNKLPQIKSISKCQAAHQQLKKPYSLIFLLFSIFVLVINCLVHDWIAISIITFMVFFIFQSSINEMYNNNQKMQVNHYYENKIKVVGSDIEIPESNLVVGDVIELGEQVSFVNVDGLVVEANELFVDESYITANQLKKKKFTIEQSNSKSFDASNHIIYGETRITSGEGKMVVLNVGANVLLKRKKFQNAQYIQGPLQAELNSIEFKIQIIGIICSIIIFILLNRLEYQVEKQINLFKFSQNLNLVLFLICGFLCKPFTIHLKRAQKHLLLNIYDHKILKLNDDCFELIPQMNKIIFNSTVYFQTNQSIIQNIWNDEIIYQDSQLINSFCNEFKKALTQCCYLNQIQYLAEQEYQGSIWDFGCQLDDKITNQFIFKKNNLVTIINQNRLLIRGDVQTILEASTSYHSHKEGLKKLDQNFYNQILQYLQNVTQEQLVVGIAYSDFQSNFLSKINDMKNGNQIKQHELNLTFLGLLALIDPLRESTIQSIRKIQDSGIDVVLATSADRDEAQQIAIKFNLYNENTSIIDGLTLEKELDDNNQQFLNNINKISVLHNVTPYQKYQFIEQLQKQGQIVGYCGRQKDDVLPIIQADVGISFQACEVIPILNYSNLILEQSNISEIISSITLTRNFLDTMKRFTQYIITNSLSLILIIIIASIKVGNNQFKPLQIFWIFIIINLISALALQIAPSNKDLLQRKNQQDYQLLNKTIITQILTMSFYQVIACLIFINEPIMLFNCFILILVFNLISLRLINLEINVFKGLFSNRMIFITFLIILVIQFFIIYKSDGLSLQKWLMCLGLGFGSLLWRIIIGLILYLLFKQKKNDHVEL